MVAVQNPFSHTASAFAHSLPVSITSGSGGPAGTSSIGGGGGGFGGGGGLLQAPTKQAEMRIITDVFTLLFMTTLCPIAS